MKKFEMASTKTIIAELTLMFGISISSGWRLFHLLNGNGYARVFNRGKK